MARVAVCGSRSMRSGNASRSPWLCSGRSSNATTWPRCRCCQWASWRALAPIGSRQGSDAPGVDANSRLPARRARKRGDSGQCAHRAWLQPDLPTPGSPYTRVECPPDSTQVASSVGQPGIRQGAEGAGVVAVMGVGSSWRRDARKCGAPVPPARLWRLPQASTKSGSSGNREPSRLSSPNQVCCAPAAVVI